MPNTFEGHLNADGLRFAIVASRFNRFVTDRLVDGAIDGVRRHGGQEDNIDVFWVPGAFEIPLIARELAKAGKYCGIICLGAVIKGETAHFEYISSAVTQGLMDVNLEYGTPVSFGVLTSYTEEQALVRSADNDKNKGSEAASAVLEMIALLKKI